MWDTAWEDSARELLDRARRESVALGDDYVGSQHLLLAAVAAAPVELQSIDALNRDAVAAAVVACRDVRDPTSILVTQGSQTPRAKLVIMHAWQRAAAESRLVTVGDLWSGLLEAGQSDVQQILRHLGLRTESLRRRISSAKKS